MASSCYNTQNTNKLITLMSFLCMISLTQATKNNSLIRHMCSTTSAPGVCIKCIEHDSSDIQIDDDVIQAMLECGDTDALILEDNVNRILDDPKTKHKRRGTLVAINPLIQAIIADGGIVQIQAAQRKFGDAKSSINNLIMSRLKKCNSVLNSSGVFIPPRVFNGLLNVEADYKLSYQLISSVNVLDE